MHILHAAGEKAAGARSGVIDRADDAGLGQRGVILHKDQRGGQAHNIARGKVFTRRFVRTFGKAPDQLLKDQPHLVAGDRRWTQVHGRHPLHHLEEQVGLGQLAHKVGKLKVFKDLAGIGRKALDIGGQVALDIGAAQLAQIHGRAIVEGLARGAQQKFFARRSLQLGHGLEPFDLGQHLWLARGQHTFQPAQNCKRQDHPAILRLFKVTAQ